MANYYNYYPNVTSSPRRSRFVLPTLISLCTLLVFLLSACSGDAVATSSTFPTLSLRTPTPSDYVIKVFFSKAPISLNSNFAAVYPVRRISTTSAVGTFAIQLLIAGPTITEQHDGYFTEINTMLSGPSKCTTTTVGGPDFTLTLNKKGSVSEKGTATLKFCRALNSGGIGTDARVQAEINATLKQFPTIKKVVILTEDGACFGDMSGQNRCLK